MIKGHAIAGKEGVVRRFAVYGIAVAGVYGRIRQHDLSGRKAFVVVQQRRQRLRFDGLGFKVVEKLVFISRSDVRRVIVRHDGGLDDIIRRVIADRLNGIHVDI